MGANSNALSGGNASPLIAWMYGCLNLHAIGILLPEMEDRVVVDPNVCNGRPVIRGTRITVQTVLEFLGAGDSIEEVLDEYPSLKREDVLACLQYSSRLMGNHFRVEALA